MQDVRLCGMFFVTNEIILPGKVCCLKVKLEINLAMQNMSQLLTVPENFKTCLCATSYLNQYLFKFKFFNLN